MYIIKINKKFTLTEYVLTKVLTFSKNLLKQSKIFFIQIVYYPIVTIDLQKYKIIRINEIICLTSRGSLVRI